MCSYPSVSESKTIDSISPVSLQDIEQHLKTQLPPVCDIIKTASSMQVKKVTIAEAMNKNAIYKGTLSEVDKLLKL